MVDLKKLAAKMLSPYARHKMKWTGCKLCPLHLTRQNVCIIRGQRVPADVLFVGEAPGPSEDCLGKPFVGPAGHLIDQIIDRAWSKAYGYCFTNLVGCMPLDDGGEKFAEPPKESIMACAPRLTEIISIVNPKLIVRVGKLSDKHCPHYNGAGECGIIHPAAILRMDISQQSLAVKRCIAILEDAAAKYLR